MNTKATTAKLDRQIIAAYLRGDTTSSISAAYGVSVPTVRARVMAAGIVLRPRTAYWRGGERKG